jgi:hypothetical protein
MVVGHLIRQQGESAVGEVGDEQTRLHRVNPLRAFRGRGDGVGR